MAASIFVQTRAVKKCPTCESTAGPFGIAGEYQRAKWRRLFDFCPACVKETARRALVPACFVADTKPPLRPRQGYDSEETRGLITALNKALDSDSQPG